MLVLAQHGLVGPMQTPLEQPGGSQDARSINTRLPRAYEIRINTSDPVRPPRPVTLSCGLSATPTASSKPLLEFARSSPAKPQIGKPARRGDSRIPLRPDSIM
jgi:hypothetical protein